MRASLVEAAAISAAVLLTAMGAVHVYWAGGGRAGKASAIPTRDGRPVLRPSAVGTLLVAFVLLAMAVTVAMAGGVLPTPIPRRWASFAAGLIALAFALRAIGDFRYVGLFKRVRSSRFAALDTWAYVPLCLALAIVVAVVASGVAFGVP